MSCYPSILLNRYRETDRNMLLKLFHPLASLFYTSFPVFLKRLKNGIIGFPSNEESTSNSNQFIPAHPIISEVKFLIVCVSKILSLVGDQQV